MNLNNLDTWFSKNKLRCCLLFASFAMVGVFWCLGMITCSRAVVQHSDPASYILLFEDANLNHFILGRLVFNTMEYLYAGKGLIWIFLKSLSVLDVIWLMLGIVILFQDSQHHHASTMKMFTLILIFSAVLIVMVYSLFLAYAAIQLTTEAGFAILRMAGTYGWIAGLGLVLCSLVMAGIMVFQKK